MRRADARTKQVREGTPAFTCYVRGLSRFRCVLPWQLPPLQEIVKNALDARVIGKIFEEIFVQSLQTGIPFFYFTRENASYMLGHLV
jgi:hypothetical protein